MVRKRGSLKPQLIVQNVHDYNQWVGHPDQHPLVSVIHYDVLPPIRHSRTQFSTYALFLRDDSLEDLTYGSGSYRYQEGSLICVSPGQIGGVPDNGEVFRIRGWALLFHPDLLHGTPLAKRIRQYGFFAYDANEALHMQPEERKTIISLFEKIQKELHHPADPYQQTLLVAGIEMLLAFCGRFYDRQYTAEGHVRKDILSRLEQVLDDFYQHQEHRRHGVPSVSWCASKLHLSANYLGDLIRKETGRTAIRLIGEYLVNQAKNRLVAGERIASISDGLGFSHPQHLTRLFKKHTGTTPTAYRNGKNHLKAQA